MYFWPETISIIFLEKITHILFDNFFVGKKSELSREPLMHRFLVGRQKREFEFKCHEILGHKDKNRVVGTWGAKGVCAPLIFWKKGPKLVHNFALLHGS